MTGVAAWPGGITTDDETPGTPPAVVLTERLWQSRYQRDAAVIGRHVNVDGAAATVVGVISDRSGLPSAATMFLPLAATPPAGASRDVRTLRVFGRLGPAPASPTRPPTSTPSPPTSPAASPPPTPAPGCASSRSTSACSVGRRRGAAGGHSSSPGWW